MNAVRMWYKYSYTVCFSFLLNVDDSEFVVFFHFSHYSLPFCKSDKINTKQAQTT